MGLTITEKILSRASGMNVSAGDFILAKIDTKIDTLEINLEEGKYTPIDLVKTNRSYCGRHTLMRGFIE